MKQWIHDAEMFAEEMLEEDPELFQKLMKSPLKMQILREVATAGKAVYEEMKTQIPAMVERGMDEYEARGIARDYSQEAMRAALSRQMELIMPGFQKMYR